MTSSECLSSNRRSVITNKKCLENSECWVCFEFNFALSSCNQNEIILKNIPLLQYLYCEVIYEMFHILNCGFLKSSKLWSSQLWTQFKQLRKEAWKSQDWITSIYIINSIDKPNFRASLPHRRSTTVSLETNPLYSLAQMDF